MSTYKFLDSHTTNLSAVDFHAGSPVYALNRTQTPAIFLRCAKFYPDRIVRAVCRFSRYLLYTV